MDNVFVSKRFSPGLNRPCSDKRLSGRSPWITLSFRDIQFDLFHHSTALHSIIYLYTLHSTVHIPQLCARLLMNLCTADRFLQLGIRLYIAMDCVILPDFSWTFFPFLQVENVLEVSLHMASGRSNWTYTTTLFLLALIWTFHATNSRNS
jgi:hypothetical protein